MIPKTIQAMAVALGFPSEVEGKVLLLKKSHSPLDSNDLSWA